MTAALCVESAAGVRTLTLRSPQRRNALSPQMLSELARALADDALAGAIAVVISGAQGCFSAGADLHHLSGTDGDVAFDDQLDHTVAALRTAPVPVIAAIDGACIGAAVDLAIACDVRVCSQHAFFEIPATRLGLLYNPAGLRRLQAALPAQTVARLLLLGERIAGPDAPCAGIVARCVADGSALPTALELASGLQRCIRRATCATKAVLNDDGAVERWQSTRLELLASHARGAAIQRARSDPAPRPTGGR